ncbi:TRAM domain protein [uncultured archaeon]|nr:TRAM domain protein [uncultured archaeon]
MDGIGRPVEEGKEYEVAIDAKGAKGDGIAHVEGFVIFVSGGEVGQKVKVKVTAVKRTFAIAEVVGVSSSTDG